VVCALSPPVLSVRTGQGEGGCCGPPPCGRLLGDEGDCGDAGFDRQVRLDGCLGGAQVAQGVVCLLWSGGERRRRTGPRMAGTRGMPGGRAGSERGTGRARAGRARDFIAEPVRVIEPDAEPAHSGEQVLQLVQHCCIDRAGRPSRCEARRAASRPGGHSLRRICPACRRAARRWGQAASAFAARRAAGAIRSRARTATGGW
jgi:hypothetical protein